MHTAKTALLLFARSTAGEIQEKWLPNGKEIYSLLNQRAQSLAEESGMAFFHSTEKDQIGTDFGSRFAHALKQIFDQGFTSVISIGNDTPQLCRNDIHMAWEKLQDHKSVIGPSKDGGIYLLGIHSCDFDYEEFSQLKWCTRHVQNDLVNYFQIKGAKLYYLRLYCDLDSALDIPVLSNVRSFIPIGLLSLIRTAIQQLIEGFNPPQILTLNALWQPHLNKGSPR